MVNINNDGKFGINLHQQNIAHRLLAHDAIMAWLHREKKEWILCLQEPYIGKKGMSKLPQGYGAFWSERIVYGSIKTRTAIIALKKLQGYLVTQLSSVDCTIVRFENLKITIVSIYCSIDINIDKSMENVLKECELNRKVIVGADVNAYHRLWGSVFKEKLQYRGIKRGLELVEIIDENGLEIVNRVPHMATFVQYESGRKEGKQMSHIDVTLCTPAVLDNIKHWKVVDEGYFTDHRCIRYEISCTVSKKIRQVEENIIRWKKPSVKMERKMREGLKKEVTFKRRMDNVTEVAKFIEQHCVQVREVLQKVFRKDKKHQQSREMYWLWRKLMKN